MEKREVSTATRFDVTGHHVIMETDMDRHLGVDSLTFN